ncbi:MAG: hypothetical protein ACLFN8_03270 [Candidatus Woesearchaeota archaeon]
MTSIGFKKTTEGVKDELKTISNLEEFIDKESKVLSNFATSLRYEFDELKHLESNFNVIRSHVQSLERQVEYKSDLIYHFHKENSARILNIDNLKKIIHLLKRVESQINEMSGVILSEIQKLLIDQTHVLYNMSDQNKKIMNSVDKGARDIKAKVLTLINRHKISFDELNRAEQQIFALERERKNSENKPNSVGF